MSGAAATACTLGSCKTDGEGNRPHPRFVRARFVGLKRIDRARSIRGDTVYL